VPDDDGGGASGMHARMLRALPAPPPTAAAPTSSLNVGLMAWDTALADLFPAGIIRTQRKRT
jgi:hypothetical protein